MAKWTARSGLIAGGVTAAVAGIVVTTLMLSGGGQAQPVAVATNPVPSTSTTAPATPTTTTAHPTRTATPRPTLTRRPKPTATLRKPAPAGGDIPKHTPTTAPTPNDGVPATGAGTFTVSAGGTDVVGTGTTLVTYRTEVEDGISWGTNPVWTPDSFAAAVDGIIADPRGWTAAAAAPITDPAQKLTNASWSFQRVSGASYSVRILLATPTTTDKMCATVGLDTEGVYSCRYGTTILINLRRWLTGAPGFAMNLDGYHTMVINHEMGHRLGFAHMTCPTPGQPAPVMSEETIDLGGCLPNAYPFSADGTFITGPWAAS